MVATPRPGSGGRPMDDQPGRRGATIRIGLDAGDRRTSRPTPRRGCCGSGPCRRRHPAPVMVRSQAAARREHRTTVPARGGRLSRRGNIQAGWRYQQCARSRVADPGDRQGGHSSAPRSWRRCGSPRRPQSGRTGGERIPGPEGATGTRFHGDASLSSRSAFSRTGRTHTYRLGIHEFRE